MATKTTVKKPIKLVNTKSDYLLIDWDNDEIHFVKKENLQTKIKDLNNDVDLSYLLVIDLNTECEFEIEENKTFSLVKIVN